MIYWCLIGAATVWKSTNNLIEGDELRWAAISFSHGWTVLQRVSHCKQDKSGDIQSVAENQFYTWYEPVLPHSPTLLFIFIHSVLRNSDKPIKPNQSLASSLAALSSLVQSVLGKVRCNYLFECFKTMLQSCYRAALQQQRTNWALKVQELHKALFKFAKNLTLH